MTIRILALSLLIVSSALQGQPVSERPMIFFDWGKNELTGDAKAVLDGVATEATRIGVRRLTLRSHSDRSGSEATNARLSRTRGEIAKAYLASKGVPAQTILVEAFGEQQPLIATADGVREVQNRRIEVVFGE